MARVRQADPGGEPSDHARACAGPNKVPTDGGTNAHPKRIERWPLNRLKPHPRQDANFHALSDSDLRQLADDMAVNGQVTPVEALPDGTMLTGHQRRRAAERLGWPEVTVWVRDDLAGDEYAAERRMIEDNRDRRQLDMLDQVRIAKRLVELKRQKPPGGLTGHQQHDTRDLIAQEVGRTGRHIQRYMNVLKSLMEIQRLVSTGKLTLALAETVARLPEAAQRQIAMDIEVGGQPAEVVAPHVPEADAAEVDPDKELGLFHEASLRALETLGGREGEVRLPRYGMDVNAYLKEWGHTTAMIARIVDRMKALKKEVAADLRKFKRREAKFNRES